MNADLQAHAETAIRTMKAAGFDHAQAVAKTADFDELNVTNNDVNLFRTVNKPSLDLKGIMEVRIGGMEPAEGTLRCPAMMVCGCTEFCTELYRILYRINSVCVQN